MMRVSVSDHRRGLKAPVSGSLSGEGALVQNPAESQAAVRDLVEGVQREGADPPQIKGPVELPERKRKEEEVQLDRPEAGTSPPGPLPMIVSLVLELPERDLFLVLRVIRLFFSGSF